MLALLVTALHLTTTAPVYSADDHPDTLPQALKQDVRLSHLTNEQGLSSNKVMSLIQDSRGFMWFGTSDGLDRYDGYEFRAFKYDPEDENSLSSNSIQALFEDQAGALWVGTSGGGLNRFDRAMERFVHFRHNPDDPNSLGSDSVSAIYQDRQGEIWIGTRGGGLNRLIVDTGEETEAETDSNGGIRFIRYLNDANDPQSLSDNSVTSIYQDQQGALWVGTSNGGLNKCTPPVGGAQGMRCTSFQHDPDDPYSLRSNEIRFIHEDRLGALWIGTWGGGLERLDLNSESSQPVHLTHYQHDPDNPHSISHDIVLSIHEDKAGLLWLGTARGLDRFDPQPGQGQELRFRHIQPDPNDPHSLTHPVIPALWGDRAGNLWMGTLAGGVNRLDLEAKPFTHIRNKPHDPNSLASNDVGAVYEDSEGVLWIGTRGGGLDRLDRRSGEMIHYVHIADNPHSLSDDRVRAIIEDRTGTLWIGTTNGLNRFDRDSGKFVTYHHDATDSNSLGNNSIAAIHVDRTGMLWVGTFSGLDRFDIETERFVHFRHAPDDPQSLSHDMVRTIHEDRSGVLWIGTTGGGLARFDRQTQQFMRYQHQPDDPRSLGDNEVISIYEDTAGVLWVGTSTGLDRFDRKTEQFIHYGERDGLPGASVVAILEEDLVRDQDSPNLWLGTSRGLSKFNPQTESFRNYDISDGLQGNQFTDNAAHKSSSGAMFFGGTNGLSAFFPLEIVDSPHAPAIVITDFQLSNKPVEIGEGSVLQQAIAETTQLALSYQHRIISFEFAALDYRAPQKNLYRYTLDGFDAGWNEANSDRRYVTYTNLNSGEYVFRVRGSNSDGVWNEQGTALAIAITPPWWATVWFRAIMLLALAVLVVGAYRWRVRSIQVRNRELEVEVATRTRELQEEVVEHENTEKRLRRTRDELTTVLDVSRDLGSTLELDRLLNLTVSQLEHVMEFDAATIHLLEGGVLELRGYDRSQYTQALPPRRVFYGEIPLLRRLIDERQGFFVSDLQAESSLVAAMMANTDDGFVEMPAIARSFLAAPLVLRGRGTGMLVLISAKVGAYGPESLDLLQIFANQLAVAIENAQRYEQAQSAAVAEERNRLAHELHDSVTQTLFSASVMAETTPAIWAKDPEQGKRNLEKLRSMTRGALAEMRTLLLELRPAAMEQLPLSQLVTTLCDSTLSHSRVPVGLAIEGGCSPPNDVKFGLYRIAQEALNNVTKHAEATEITVKLTCHEDQIALMISDNGCGFESQTVPAGHMGLTIMRERAQQIGATLHITSSPGSGTEIVATWSGKERGNHG